MTQPTLLTIREAKAALNLSGPRIHQLLLDGELEGPRLPPGRRRHSPGAPRVTAKSVARYIDSCAHVETTARVEQPDRSSTPRPTQSRTPPSDSASAYAAAQEIKISLDAMRDELRAERDRNRGLLDVIQKLTALLRDTQTSADRLDDVTSGYSRALTQLLSPDTVPSD